MSQETEKLKVVLICNKEGCRQELKELINIHIKEAVIVAIASEVLEGLRMIRQHAPAVVFVDVEMPKYSGRELIEHFNTISMSKETSDQEVPNLSRYFDVVFTDFDEKYAVQAYKAAATGYLLKPIRVDDLIDVFKKVEKRQKGKQQIKRLEEETLDKSRRIIFPTQSGLIYLAEDEICYLESSSRYTDVYLVNHQKMVSTLSLKDCLQKLANSTFIRIHRSFIINLSHIQNYSRGRDSFVIMDNDQKVDVGLFYKDDLNKAIASFLK